VGGAFPGLVSWSPAGASPVPARVIATAPGAGLIWASGNAELVATT
jgi:hypothetical protein